jgi:hypothetical protein
MTQLRFADQQRVSARTAPQSRTQDVSIMAEGAFSQIIALERKRAMRSRKTVVLMLLENLGFFIPRNDVRRRTSIEEIVVGSIRETDLVGWQSEGAVLGILFTELNGEETTVLETLRKRLREALRTTLTTNDLDQIKMTCHVFPEDRTSEASSFPIPPSTQRFSATASQMDVCSS